METLNHMICVQDDKNGRMVRQAPRAASAVMSQQFAMSVRLLRDHIILGGVLIVLALMAATSVHAMTEPKSGEPLIGSEINKTIGNRRIYLSVPFGGEFPLYYQKDGRVDGSGEAVGLGRFLAPTDSGRWWVDGNRLCQKWSQWYEGRVFCFTLEKLPNDQLIWRRDDGEMGVARIGD